MKRTCGVFLTYSSDGFKWSQPKLMLPQNTYDDGVHVKINPVGFLNRRLVLMKRTCDEEDRFFISRELPENLEEAWSDNSTFQTGWRNQTFRTARGSLLPFKPFWEELEPRQHRAHHRKRNRTSPSNVTIRGTASKKHHQRNRTSPSHVTINGTARKKHHQRNRTSPSHFTINGTARHRHHRRNRTSPSTVTINRTSPST